jgi:hypothetical protein
MMTPALWLAAATKPPISATGSFYVVAATVTPVLYLALVFQAGGIEPGDTPAGRLYSAFICGATAFVGESFALNAPLHEHPSRAAYHFTSSVLFCLGSVLVFTPIIAAADDGDKRASKHDKAAYRLPGASVVFFLVLATGIGLIWKKV